MNPGSFRFDIVMLIFLAVSSKLSCLVSCLDAQPPRYQQPDIFVSKLCNGTTTLTVTEYGLFRPRKKILQFHHIPVEHVTASVAQHMLQMTCCVVHRMVGGEEAKEISHTPYLVE